ncbi:MAG: hypothetical protein K2M34_02915 [Alphaproteobacteria bacterium]|nr:hypothetical protein [Alphaproteobacteria bacterium]
MVKAITPEIKEQAIQWRAKIISGTDIASFGYVTKYSLYTPARGNLILIPGMASNCKTEPLFQEFITWGLRHKYDVYSLETFLGRFQPDVNLKYAQENTVPELINLIDTGLETIAKHASNNPMRIVAHSAGAVGTMFAINKQIAQKRPINIENVTLFAPFIADERFARIKKFYRLRSKSEEEFQRTPIRVENPFVNPPQPRYISVLPAFFEQITNLNLVTPETATYNFPVTIVGGGRDNKVPCDALQKLYKKLATLPNGERFQYVLFPKSNHSFISQSNNLFDILSRINPYIFHDIVR